MAEVLVKSSTDGSSVTKCSVDPVDDAYKLSEDSIARRH